MPQNIISQFDRKYAKPIETYRQVNNATNRDNIPEAVRWEGMMVYVVSEAKTYYLGSGLQNEDWTDIGGIVDINVQNNLSSTSTVDALSAYQGKLLNEKFTDYQLLSGRGVANGYVPLNSAGLIDNAYIPSYVDDIIEVSSYSNLPATGEPGKIYITLDDNLMFRWSGSSYVPVGGTGSVSWVSISGKPTTLAGYGITDAYSKTESNSRYLGKTEKATDSEKLDGLNSSQFARTDISETFNQDVTVSETLITKKVYLATDRPWSIEQGLSGSSSTLDILSESDNKKLRIGDSGSDTVFQINSSTGNIELSGTIGRAAHSSGYQVGSYNSVGENSSKTNPIYTIGSNYKPTDTSLGNMYGIGYSYQNPTFLNSTDLGTAPSNWGLYVTHAGKAGILLQGNGIGRFKETVYAKAFKENSDERLKTNIKPISKTFREFNFKDELEVKRFGVVAQEIEKFIPEVVETDSEGMKNVNYIDLLCKIVAEQETKIEKIEKIINDLKN